MKLVTKIEDIPGIIFRSRRFDGESHHFRCEKGNYDKKEFMIGKKVVRMTFGKRSDCHMLIVLFAPFRVSIKYDILIRVGEIKEPSVCEELRNDSKDELVFYCGRLTLNVRKINNSLISESIMDMVSGIINRQRY